MVLKLTWVLELTKKNMFKYKIEKSDSGYMVCLSVPNTPDYPKYYNNNYNFPTINTILIKTKTLKEAKKFVKNKEYL